MQKTCPNGHLYDTNIYGDQCPLCPAGAAAPASHGSGPATQLGGAPAHGASVPGSGMHTHIAGAQPQNPSMRPGMRPQGAQMGATARAQQPPQAPAAGGHTVIRHAGQRQVAGQPAPSRKLVGFLVCYNRDPNGRAYNIYEGRNYIGRNADCDISVPDDDQMSGRHMSILYRNVDNKFKFRDEQSSNGTFVNKELLDDGTLENNDIIRAGNTLFIFMAIPQLF